MKSAITVCAISSYLCCLSEAHDLQGSRPPGLPVPDHIVERRLAKPSNPPTPPKPKRRYCLDCHHAKGPRTLRQRRLDYLRDMWYALLYLSPQRNPRSDTLTLCSHMANPSDMAPELPPPLRHYSTTSRGCNWTIDCGTVGAWRNCPKRQLAIYAQNFVDSLTWLAEKRDDLHRLLQEREAKKRGYDVTLYTTPSHPAQVEIISVEDPELVTY